MAGRTWSRHLEDEDSFSDTSTFLMDDGDDDASFTRWRSLDRGSCWVHSLVDLRDQAAAYSLADSCVTTPRSTPPPRCDYGAETKCCISFVSCFVLQQPDGLDAQCCLCRGLCFCQQIFAVYSLLCGTVWHSLSLSIHVSISTQLLLFAKLETLYAECHLFFCVCVFVCLSNRQQNVHDTLVQTFQTVQLSYAGVSTELTLISHTTSFENNAVCFC